MEGGSVMSAEVMPELCEQSIWGRTVCGVKVTNLGGWRSVGVSLGGNSKSFFGCVEFELFLRRRLEMSTRPLMMWNWNWEERLGQRHICLDVRRGHHQEC